MYTIVLDTNFLITALKFRIDIFDDIEKICDFDYEVAVLDKSLDELNGKPNEKLIRALIKDKKVKVIKTNTRDYVDDILASLKGEYIIATQDIGLRKRLKGKPIILIRQKKSLEIILLNCSFNLSSTDFLVSS